MMLSHVANVVMISTCCERWFNAQEEMLNDLVGLMIWWAHCLGSLGFTASIYIFP